MNTEQVALAVHPLTGSSAFVTLLRLQHNPVTARVLALLLDPEQLAGSRVTVDVESSRQGS